MAGGAPPAGNEELAACGRLDVFEVLDARVFRVRAEAVLLVVHGTEDVITDALHCENSGNTLDAELNWVDRQVAGLDTVGEGDPDEIAEGKHHAKAVSDDVDCGQNRWLHVEGVEGVDGLCYRDQDDRVGYATKVAVLLHDESKIHDDPPEHARAELTPCLDVNFSKDRQHDTWIELTANKPVVEHVARVTTSGELALVGVLGVLHIEGGNVAVGSQEVGDKDVAGQDANVVFSDECPDRELSAMGDCACTKKTHDEKGGVESYYALALHGI